MRCKHPRCRCGEDATADQHPQEHSKGGCEGRRGLRIFNGRLAGHKPGTGGKQMLEIIRKGDSTSHGGVVLEGFAQTNLNGRPMAGIGHLVACPLCKGVFPIAEGSKVYKVDGTPVALHGMKTACGASLITSGSKASVHQ